MTTAHLLAVARGDAEPELVVEGGSVFSAFTRDWLSGDVAIADGRIAGVGSYSGGERIDAAGCFVVPGFVDAHVHLESAKLTPAEFARAVVPRGTTTVVCDPHEIANVAGVAGVRWLLDAAESLPLDVFAMAPSCVPAGPFESPAGALGPDDVRALLLHPRVIGIAEVMDFRGLVDGDPEVLAKLVDSHVDGHAPGLEGPMLDAYVAAGVRTDHEAATASDALARRERGLWVLMREASNAHDLVALLPLVAERGPDYCAFCTDDCDPALLLRDGHVDHLCRLAVANGIPAEDALVMATLHGARAHGLLDRGAIAPGLVADLVLLEDLTSFRVAAVVKDGAPPAFPADAPPSLSGTVRVAPVTAATFALAGAPARVRLIEVVPGAFETRAAVDRPSLRDGLVVADPARDIAKIALVERHRATGRVGVALVRGFGLQRGAFASTVAHDAHNLLVVGVSDDDMALCVRRVEELGGGHVVACDGAVRAELALPVAGLMSIEDAETVARASAGVDRQLREQGVRIDAPLMALSYLALSTTPALKITDRGLLDVEQQKLVGVEISG